MKSTGDANKTDKSLFDVGTGWMDGWMNINNFLSRMSIVKGRRVSFDGQFDVQLV